MAAKQVELRLYDWKLTEVEPRKAIEKIAAEFEKKYPNIKVKLEEVAWPDHQKKLVILAQGGTPPDVARITDAGLLPLANIGALEPLNDLAQKHKIDDFLTKIPATVRKGLQFKGADYYATTYASIDMLTINKTLYKAGGLDPEKPPTTWDQFLEYAKKLTITEKDQYGFGVVSGRSNSASRRVVSWILSGGGEMFSPDGKELIANSEGGLKGFQFWVDLATKHKVAPPGSAKAEFADVLRGYGQSKIAMIDGGPNNPQQVEPDYPGIVENSKMAAMPDPWRPPLRPGGFVLMSGSQNKDEAYLLTAFLASVFGQVEYALGAYAVPIRSDASKDPTLMGQRLIAEAAAQSSKGVANPMLHVLWAEIEQKLFDAMQAALSGAKTPKQALDDFVSDGNQILKRG